jgi:retron-type reverse transcriptase
VKSALKRLEWRASSAGLRHGFLDLDIKAFFDSSEHNLFMRAVRNQADGWWVLRYIVIGHENNPPVVIESVQTGS